MLRRDDSVARFLPLLPVLVLFLVSGFRGIDFGTHWDESIVRDGVVRSIRDGTVASGRYNYPGYLHKIGLGLAFADPSVRRAVRKGDPEGAERAVRSKPYLLRLRAAVLVHVALAIVWIYALVLSWTSRPLAAVAAAAALGGSWEVAYHARWATVDPLVLHFAALALLLIRRYWVATNGAAFVLLAAVAAGFAAGSKYPGAILLAPLFLSIALRGIPFGKKAVLWFACGALAVAAFLLTTPGAALEWRSFAQDLAAERAHYAETGHRGYTVAPGWEHARLLAGYLAVAALSPAWPVAAAMAAISVYGIAASFRAEKKWTAILLAAPALYAAFFVTQRVMIVRNYLILFPVLAAFFGIGFERLTSLFRSAISRRAAVAFGLAALAFNIGWLVHAAETIGRDAVSPAMIRGFAELVDRRAPNSIVATPRLRAALEAEAPHSARRLKRGPVDRNDWAALFLWEAKADQAAGRWKANRPFGVAASFGPREVNLNMYPSWMNGRRVVVVRASIARRLALFADPDE